MPLLLLIHMSVCASAKRLCFLRLAIVVHDQAECLLQPSSSGPVDCALPPSLCVHILISTSLVCTDKEASELGHKEPGRYIQCFVYVRASPDDNFYAHPLDVVVVVELQSKKVVQWWHHKANPIIPTLNSNFHTKLVDQERGWRTGLKPLNVVQPEGPSFSVDGNMVFWQKWSMRVSFNYREGLVLHTVGSVPKPL